ncbi:MULTISPECIES: SDR family oxidoreductase [Burkholderiaceae]|uniref:SDR family oxidoreductase n=1 Tax=Burkholderiaceae TaxID=119060 RepID=UPI00096838E3|nr:MULTISPECIES: SDR family oxidoreductase [Burkholderiaceae]SIT70357.1 hypothetical protein SAMN04487768_1941 [Burkholderia sp. b13]
MSDPSCAGQYPASPSYAPPVRRVALVTGAARRIGRALALGMAARGWDIAVHYHTSEADAQSLTADIQALGQRAVALRADLADEAQVRRLVPDSIAALGRIECVVNNASLFDEDTAATFGYGTLLNMTAINVGAPLALAQALHESIPEVAREDETLRGSVINVLDQKLYNMNPDYLSYTLTKAALQAATVALAQALAPKLRVVAVAPGLTLRSGSQTDESFSDAHRRTPLGRASTPADLVEAVCYLADARGVTGATLLVDGGQHLVPSPRDVMFMTDT